MPTIDRETTRKFLHRFRRLIGTITLGVIAGLIAWGIGEYMTRPSPEYRIAVVASERDEIWEDLAEGIKHFEELEREKLKRLRIKLAILDYEGSFQDPEEQAKQLMEDPHVLGIVLSMTSTEASQLLDHYQGNKPVLLARATNPHLTLYDNVFRLPPNDKKQVATLTQFLRDRHKDIVRRGDTSTKIAIFRDYRNETYAGYIADNVRENLDRWIVSTGAEDIRVIVDGEIGGHNLGVHVSSDFAQNIKPNLLLYAGNGRSLLPLIHQAASFAGSLATLVLTEGCVHSRFLTLAQGSFHEAYATFPALPDEERYSRRSPRRPSKWENEPSYRPYGYDAIAILIEANRAGAIERGSSEKEAETRVIKSDELVESLKQLHFQGMAGNYSFKNGENTEGRFHVYRAVFDEATSSWLWKHSPSDCPFAIS